MVRPPHLPPIGGDEEAKRKWRLMNRPSITRLHVGPNKGRVNPKNGFMPTYNKRTYNNQRSFSNQRTPNNHNNNDYQELGSIITFIVLAVIILTLIIVFGGSCYQLAL